MAFDIALNTSRILTEVWQDPGISRVALATRLGLNKSTITKIVTSLIERDIVCDSAKYSSSPNGGRRKVKLAINDNLGLIIGIEIQTEQWAMVLLNPSGDIISSHTQSYADNDMEVTQIIRGVLTEALKRAAKFKLPILGAGIGLSGIINPYEGIINRSNPLRVNTPINIYSRLKEHFPFPILIENDAKCCCWNELVQLKKRRERNTLCILGEFRRTRSGKDESTGIALGLGLIVKGSVLHGDAFSAGEFQSILKSRTNPTQFDLEPDLSSKIREDNSIWTQVISELSKNVALLVNTMNITRISVFGDFVLDKGRFKEILEFEIQKNWSYENRVNYSVDFSAQNGISVAYGAAGMFIEKLFSVPDFVDMKNDVYPTGFNFLELTLNRG